MHHLITQQHIDDFQRDGVVLIKGLFKDHIDDLCKGIAFNMENPGPSYCQIWCLRFQGHAAT
jgi:hypothetical protein